MAGSGDPPPSAGPAVGTPPARPGGADAVLRYPRFIARRVAQAIPVVLAIIVINFLLIHLAPGDPAHTLVGDAETSPEVLEQVRRDFGLDRPLVLQLGAYVTKVLQFDLGYSFRFRRPVFDLIKERIPATLLLMGTALTVSSAIGVLLGVLAARRPFGWVDNGTTLLALVGYSMPAFWLGQLLLLAFALHNPWFPVQGMVSLRAPSSGMGRALDIAHHLVLPATVYGIYQLTLIFRLTRVKMMDVLVQDYVTAARAKGVSEPMVLLRHALPNALLPVVTIIGANFGFMLAGSVLVETIFGWPGMGRLMYEAIGGRDFPLLLGLLTVVSFFVIACNILTDIVYALIDPRVLYR